MIKTWHYFATLNCHDNKETYTHKYSVSDILADKNDNKMNGEKKTLHREFFGKR